jgi:hypothetical protein
LFLSATFVKANEEILLHAVDSYRASVLKAVKWPQTVLDDPKLSLLPDLKAHIESSIEIKDDMFKLLRTIVNEYRRYLTDLIQESWANKEEIAKRRDELSERDFLEDLPP